MIAPLWLVGSAGALQLALTREQLCAMSDLVAVVELTGIEHRWATDGGIERQADLTVQRVVHGPEVDDLSLVLPGGTMGELTLWIEDVPELVEHQPYLVLLKRHDTLGWTFLGGDGGAIPLALADGHAGEPLQAALASLGSCDAP